MMLAAEHESLRHWDWKQLALEDRHGTQTAHGTPGVRDATLLSYQLTALPNSYVCGRHVDHQLSAKPSVFRDSTNVRDTTG